MLILFKLGKEYMAFICILMLCDLAVKCVISSPPITGITKRTSTQDDESDFFLGPNEVEIPIRRLYLNKVNKERKGFEEKAEKKELQKEVKEKLKKEVKEEDYGTEIQKKITKIMETMTNERLKYELIDAGIVKNIKVAFDNLYAKDWELYDKYDNGDKIETKVYDGYTIYRGTAVLDVSAEKVIEELYDNFDGTPFWNDTFQKCKVLEKIGKDTDITYAEIKIPASSNRDVIVFRHKSKFGDAYAVFDMSINCDCDPVKNNYWKPVRAYTGPSCSVTKPLGPNKSLQLILLDNDLKGYLGRVTALLLSKGQQKYMSVLRNHLEKLWP